MQAELLLDTNQHMPYLFWNSKEKRLEPSPDAALPVAQVRGLLEQIYQLMETPGATLRFHSLKKMETAVQTSTSIPFVWMVSSRVNPDLWARINSLSYHSIWLLNKSRLKPHTASRSPAAQQLQRLLK